MKLSSSALVLNNLFVLLSLVDAGGEYYKTGKKGSSPMMGGGGKKAKSGKKEETMTMNMHMKIMVGSSMAPGLSMGMAYPMMESYAPAAPAAYPTAYGYRKRDLRRHHTQTERGETHSRRRQTSSNKDTKPRKHYQKYAPQRH